MLLTDESVNNNLIIAMRKSGFNVFSIKEEKLSIDDEEIAEMSLNPPGIIISQDKDFGEIVYHKNLTVAGVILLRYLPKGYNIIESKLLNYLAAHLNECWKICCNNSQTYQNKISSIIINIE